MNPTIRAEAQLSHLKMRASNQITDSEQVVPENGAETEVLGIKKPLITGVRTVRNS